jgi:hypothetical protein
VKIVVVDQKVNVIAVAVVSAIRTVGISSDDTRQKQNRSQNWKHT